ncbi:hypothetical protein LOTGIDRAFT_159332 [Lottia gigantea]|uniref:GON domain-containing protein n=1 Tax=Lottia gigantea TaxID=225164 RepID=V4C6L8_LOTGI|nr:hypothetical protein LOTGIDRAFT_159332 [Lottia gigantea]ESO97309.1 hypothetical protein LOTGIDRAFT_159332 [Lottia gigantea]
MGELKFRYGFKMLPAIILILDEFNICEGNQCFKPDTVSDVNMDSKFEAEEFSVQTSIGPVDCVRTCKSSRLCQFVNFHKRSLNCSLLAVEGPLITDHDYIGIDSYKWNDNMMGGCKNHLCPYNTLCVTEGGSYTCIPRGCGGLPQVYNINATSFYSKLLWNFGEVVEYACIQGFFTRTNATCLSTGLWDNFQCTAFSQCDDDGICRKKSENFYWFFLPATMTLQKVHCTVGVGPSVLLENYNMASTPAYTRRHGKCILIPHQDPMSYNMGYTDFQMARLILFPLQIKIDSQMFGNTTYTRQDFGKAGDCYAGFDSSVCGVIGRFIINTRGTGFKIKESVKWKTWGIAGVFANFTRSPDGHVIEGYCGGNCGGCEVDGILYLEHDPFFTPPFESAELPFCRFPL